MKKSVNLKLEKGYRYTTIKNRYKLISNERQFNRYVKYVKKGGNYKQKISQIKEFIWMKFCHARDNFLPVHDKDL
jgi:hypothetical protein